MPSVPTAPGRLPLLGHLPRLARDPLDFLARQRALGDLVRVYLGPRPVHVVYSPDLVRRVLATDAAKFQRGKVFRTARALLGDGLATADDPVHRHQRRVVRPAFQRERITAYAEVMREQAELVSGSWRPGRVVHAEREMAELALTTTARALFRTGLGQAAVAEVHRSLTPVLNGVTGRALLPDPLGALPTPGNRRFRDSLHRLVSIVDDMVARYRASGTDHGDLLSTLVATHHSDAEVRAQVLNLLMAGTETTATTLTWALYQLAASPEATARLSAELAAELGERPVTAADLPRLGYLDRVLTEVLRLRTPVWLLMRTTVAPVRLAGAELPPGTEVLVVPPVLHRDPALYPAPLAFHPDRWLAPEADTWRRTRLFAFGAGAHHCVGDGFARTEMAIALATIHRRWHVRLAPGARVRERTRAFLKPTGVSLLVDPR